QQAVYIEVLDGKQKVLLLANAPHPDLSAIKQSLNAHKNYDTDVILANAIPKNIALYDVIIVHNLPSINSPLNDFFANNTHKPFWFIIGTGTHIPYFNQVQSIIQVNDNNQQQDYYPRLNTDFSSFSVSNEVSD